MIKARLSLMMFFQFFIWGAWFVTLGTFLSITLGAESGEISMAFSTQSWGAIIAPLIVGMIADKFFNAEIMLGVLHLAGGALMMGMYLSADFGAFYPLVLSYMIIYMPTLALVNSISFAQVDDPSKEFGAIRVWGTIGWIVAGLVISYVFAWDSQGALASGALKNTFLMSAIASFCLGVFSFTLPSTPPPGKGKKTTIGGLLGADALFLLKDRNFLVFFLSSILICIPLSFYYQNANPFLTGIGVENATGKMTLGQMSEVIFMLAVPIFLTRLGIKLTLLIGMAAWVLRYIAFSFGAEDSASFLLIIGIVLHGICYDFFFVSGQIYTDSKASENTKNAAQGMITLATYGAGMLVGFWAAGKVTKFYTNNGIADWSAIWQFPAIFAAVVMVIFLITFKNEKI